MYIVYLSDLSGRLAVCLRLRLPGVSPSILLARVSVDIDGFCRLFRQALEFAVGIRGTSPATWLA